MGELETIAQRIQDFYKKLPSHIQIALDDIKVQQSFNKGDYLLRPGSVCRFSYHIQSGLARKFYQSKSGEVTTDFFFPDDIALSFTSYTLQKPSEEAIQVLLPTIAQRMDYLAFVNIKARYPALIELDLLLTEYFAVWQEDRIRQFRLLNATERYELLLYKNPNWLNKIQLTHIASYLGISLETLSRIRSKIL